jgi:hypothetical protein
VSLNSRPEKVVELEKQYKLASLSISRHTAEAGHCLVGERPKAENEYCSCETCYANRKLLTSIVDSLTSLGYRRRAIELLE